MARNRVFVRASRNEVADLLADAAKYPRWVVGPSRSERPTRSSTCGAAGLTALTHCLVRREAERDQRGIPAREALAESSFQATRHGLEAHLLDRRARRVPARELARGCLDWVADLASELGCERELAHVELMLEEGNGADLQRRAYAEGGMVGLLEFLEERTSDLSG